MCFHNRSALSLLSALEGEANEASPLIVTAHAAADCWRELGHLLDRVETVTAPYLEGR